MYRIFACGGIKDWLIYKYVSVPNMSLWKLSRKTEIIPLHLLLLLTLCIICSFTLSVKKRVNVSVWISPGIRCLECWPGYCEHGSAAPVWFPSCSLHNGFSLQPTCRSFHTRAGCICCLTRSLWLSKLAPVSGFLCIRVSVYNQSFM